jgi:hypothetical protein
MMFFRKNLLVVNAIGRDCLFLQANSVKKMKKLHLLALVAIAFACNQAPKETAAVEEVVYEYYGDTITAEGAIPAAELMALMGEATEKDAKIVGTIEEVCQKKGCWMKVDLGNGEKMRITFRDYAFFVPKDASGREVILDGTAMIEETSMESLRHFAEDAGKSKEEIEAITEGTKELVFEARGVILK